MQDWAIQIYAVPSSNPIKDTVFIPCVWGMMLYTLPIKELGYRRIIYCGCFYVRCLEDQDRNFLSATSVCVGLLIGKSVPHSGYWNVSFLRYDPKHLLINLKGLKELTIVTHEGVDRHSGHYIAELVNLVPKLLATDARNAFQC